MKFLLAAEKKRNETPRDSFSQYTTTQFSCQTAQAFQAS